MTTTEENSIQAPEPRPFAATTGSGWIAITDSMPDAGVKVIVFGHWENGNRWRTTARWRPAGTIDASMWDDPPDEWWDEAEEKCVNPRAGWWEEPVEGEQMWELSNVTHWHPLPSFPNTPL